MYVVRSTCLRGKQKGGGARARAFFTAQTASAGFHHPTMQAAALSLPALLAYLRPPITPRCAPPVACDFSSQRAALEKAFFTAADDTVATQEDHSAGVLRD